MGPASARGAIGCSTRPKRPSVSSPFTSSSTPKGPPMIVSGVRIVVVIRSLYTLFSETQVRVEGAGGEAGGDTPASHGGHGRTARGGRPGANHGRRGRQACGSHATDRLQQLPRGA